MPTFTKRKVDEVPHLSRVSKSIRAKQELYEDFIKSAGTDVGELDLEPDEDVRATKVRLTRAATRLGTQVQIWDADGKVYFSRTTKRGRQKKVAT
jgi:uncharacterized protein YheU (UPF0270 family)